ncbi:hypothetical protein [Bacillus sp. NPDC094106]|uniref:hypothetical protein n=1 Tax=Bacillus sp. NPDC094106 TaxID=3363949 RepID=UPI00381D336A
MDFICIAGVTLPICMLISFLYTKIVLHKDIRDTARYQWIAIVLSVIISVFIIVGYTLFIEINLNKDREKVTQQAIKKITIDEVNSFDIKIKKDARNKDRFSVPYENEIYNIYFYPDTASIKEIIKESDNENVEM